MELAGLALRCACARPPVEGGIVDRPRDARRAEQIIGLVALTASSLTLEPCAKAAYHQPDESRRHACAHTSYDGKLPARLHGQCLQNNRRVLSLRGLARTILPEKLS
jgi:hypothetical protein